MAIVYEVLGLYHCVHCERTIEVGDDIVVLDDMTYAHVGCEKDRQHMVALEEAQGIVGYCCHCFTTILSDGDYKYDADKVHVIDTSCIYELGEVSEVTAYDADGTPFAALSVDGGQHGIFRK